MQNKHPYILEVQNLGKCFYDREKTGFFRRTANQAVQNVSFEIRPRETFGIVGESGCGKSTVAKLLVGLEKPDEGSIVFDGIRIDHLPERRLRLLRPRFQMVFQDSTSSLNSRKRILDILAEPMIYHGIVDKRDAAERVDELLSMVGLPANAKFRYPHEFSGGQKQRICIARALSLNPELVVLDEPVSALDVSVQAQILNLLRDLQEKLGLAYLFIGHGLGAVHYISHRIAVMYRGRIVECGDSEELFSHPIHPYTRALLDAAPSADYDTRNRERVVLNGDAANTEWTTGCAFMSRCPYTDESCSRADFSLCRVEAGSSHLSSCSRAAQNAKGDAWCAPIHH